MTYGRGAPRAHVPRAMAKPSVDGSVAPGDEPVSEAFAENFALRGELGGAVCVYRNGEKVVDLWGGVRDCSGSVPFRGDTMAVVHSTTKGLAAMVLALLHSRGQVDYDERVATYWPEFAQAGKETITLRQLLAHQAGLFAFDEHVDREVVADVDRLARIMERQRPAWPPGERQAYHAITLGFYENEIVRRIDPAHRTLGRVFDEEIARPLGLDAYLRVPEAIPDARLAPLEPPSLWRRLTAMPLSFTVAVMNPRSILHRALVANPGTSFYIDPHRVIARELEAPSGLAVASAHALAKVYGVFASGGHELGLRPATLAALEAPATPSQRGFHDELFRAPAKFSLGFMKPNESVRFGHDDRAYGAPGTGGSIGYADPAVGTPSRGRSTDLRIFCRRDFIHLHPREMATLAKARSSWLLTRRS